MNTENSTKSIIEIRNVIETFRESEEERKRTNGATSSN